MALKDLTLKEIKENAIDLLQLNINESDINDKKDFKEIIKYKKKKLQVKKAKTIKKIIKIMKPLYGKKIEEMLEEGVINW